jgi:hypothetical protein
VNSVKNIDLTKSVFVALMLVSAVAGAEDNYPASDFQPKVLYQDEAAAKASESSPAAKPAPAAAASSSSDAEYPATNFQPKVLYSDPDYKHSAASPNSSAGSVQTVSADSDATPAATAVAESSSAGYLLGLIVFAVAGFVLFKKGTCPGVADKSSTASASKAAGGLTGVAKYLLKSSGTGVSRYLEKNAKNAPAASAATGVAKYLANQASSAKETASQAATGVEKYLRDKG